ncbi:MAG: RNA pseudouridine synthase [Pirellulales bacterium]|nr:RNA pseudouridine synthase [Pirellulales bacterium]
MNDAPTTIEILYEAGPCLAVAKPAGLLTQAPPGIDSLETRIKAFYKHRESKQGKVYLGVPHRLDRPASGAMVFARHVRAARRLSEQFEARTVRKTYWALVGGVGLPERDTWRDFVRKIPDQPRAEVVAADHADAREAVLHYRVLGASAAWSWLEIELETGRMHQVRLQAASRGWPVLGDALYGSPLPFGVQHTDERLRAIALHARSLAFCHPMTHADVSVTAPLSTDWTTLDARFDAA